VEAAHAAHATWSQLSGPARARHLYSIARHVQKHARLLAVLEAMDNGKSIRETRDSDVPVVVRHLYHHAGWAELAGEGQLAGWTSVGVVAAIVPWNFPLMLLVWKVAPALAMGNTVVLKPATYTRQAPVAAFLLIASYSLQLPALGKNLFGRFSPEI
jgi:aldehyde dehydrogenase (NAD+)